ncbi:MAG: hypothetical protein CSA38_03445 [Flavobacteriales bacterium]|nr:MAG: hypothetical protein CSA38_03445 [Flavobacteriales bacterium]
MKITKKIALIVVMGFFSLGFSQVQEGRKAALGTKDKIDQHVKTSPEFPGGMNAFRQDVADKFDIDKLDFDKFFGNISFVVEKDGRITQVKTSYGNSNELEQETVRLINLIKDKKWMPAKINGKSVRHRCYMSIRFVNRDLNVDLLSKVKSTINNSEGTLPIDDEKIYEYVGQEAMFSEGNDTFYNYIKNKFDPAITRGLSSELRTVITFVVEKNGSISQVKAEGGSPELQQEAIRTVKSIKTKWTPAKVNGRPVRSRSKFPIAMAVPEL